MRQNEYLWSKGLTCEVLIHVIKFQPRSLCMECPGCHRLVLYTPFSQRMAYIISCFPVGHRKISVKIFFDLTLVPPVKIPIFMFLLSRLIARASQPDGNIMTSFTLHFSRLNCNALLCRRGTPLGIMEKKCSGF